MMPEEGKDFPMPGSMFYSIHEGKKEVSVKR